MALLAAQGASETLRAGVTTIGDCGARYGVTIPLRDAIASGPGAGSQAVGLRRLAHGDQWPRLLLDRVGPG